MRVVIVTDTCTVDGGAAKVVLDSVRLLRARGVDITIFCGGCEVDANFKSLGVCIVSCGQYELKDARHRGLTMVKGLWNWTVAKRLKEILKQFDPHDTVVHIHAWSKVLSPSIFGVLRRSGFPTFATCHDYFFACPNGAFYNYQSHDICLMRGGSVCCLLRNCDARCYAHKIWRWLRQRIIMYQLRMFPALRLVAISDHEQCYFQGQFGNRHEFVRVNNPMTFQLGDISQGNCGDAFVFVGRMSVEKAPRLFAEAVTRCGAKGVMVGDGHLLKDIRREYPGIEFLGWKSPSEVAEVLKRRAKALVFPSVWFEGAPLAPLEAMSHGVPCIVSNVTNAVEYIDDGETGLLFKSGDVEDLVLKMKQLEDPVRRNMMVQNIRERFDRSRYDEKAHVEKLISVYSDFLSYKTTSGRN